MSDGRRHLVVDGHNVLHAWAPARSRANSTGTREQLVTALQVLYDRDDLDITVVFDGRGETSKIDPSRSEPGFVVQYAAAGLTADGVIERLAAGAADPGLITVATADATIRGNVLAAGGACITPDDLCSWIESCRGRAARSLHMPRGKSAPGFGQKLPL